MTIPCVIPTYLDVLDEQRETMFAALSGLSEDQIWQRPARGEWCIGEILDHNILLIASTLPYVRFAWRFFHRLGMRHRSRTYSASLPDPYRNPRFPMWVGFLWAPRIHPNRRVSLESIQRKMRYLHNRVRVFYEGKPEDVLGNVFVYDPYFGCLNLIVTLRIGIYHDQLHNEDIIRLAGAMNTL